MSATGKTTLVLLPGWVLGPQPLRLLAQAIERRDDTIRVQCAPYPHLKSHRLDEWLDALDARLPDDAWLGGWSMGGMLAAALAERRGRHTPGLITMGAGARVMPSEPPAGSLPPPEAWPALLDQGRHDVWHLGKRLLKTLPRTGTRQSAVELALLGAMDLRQTLRRLTMPQLHLFGEHDMLIPAPTRQVVAEHLSPAGQIQLIPDAGHGFVIDQADQTAQAIVAFMQASGR
ncbi:alpha/beta fold hydrolase [Kushneria phyllosphaerae]|uniref:Pimeloyl-[acyl-carrier protein] methyl ester esterase n=1 Tax=Kushneria phyllosphaerae TaxID=2100822 RepID=A0A2R8CKR3_9GAMM|nr:alpha/beta hydrolase [Kushneria phyllosphaerae]SPJ33486.1 Pimeloyl-[acyl-carrier protein] methyl ester esterase [Kushneria phyllosphaerae]